MALRIQDPIGAKINGASGDGRVPKRREDCLAEAANLLAQVRHEIAARGDDGSDAPQY
ncbi:MAG: hypothetical protein ACQEW8_04495 [Actinomycetota bacterium]